MQRLILHLSLGMESEMPFQPFLLWFVLVMSPVSHTPFVPVCTALSVWTAASLGGQRVSHYSHHQLQERLWCAKRLKHTGVDTCCWAIHQQGRAFQAKGAVVSILMFGLKLVYFWLQHGCLALRIIFISYLRKGWPMVLIWFRRFFFKWQAVAKWSYCVGEEEKCDQISAETYHLSQPRMLAYH